MTPVPRDARGVAAGAFVLPFGDAHPDIAASAFLAPGVTVVGDVGIGAEVTVWFGTVIRGDIEPISVARRANIQDGCVLHTDAGHPLVVGEEVAVGHGAIVHGCDIGARALIGMGAVVLSGAVVGAEAVVAAGAVVREGFDVPAATVVAGVPAEVVRRGVASPAADICARYRARAAEYGRMLAGQGSPPAG